MLMNVELRLIGFVVAALVVSGIVAFLTTPVVRTLAQRVGAMDVPKDGRRMHDHPIPRMGGLAIFLGFMISIIIVLNRSGKERIS